jgi:uncharacterized protein YfiM (DUF2279 family)
LKRNLFILYIILRYILPVNGQTASNSERTQLAIYKVNDLPADNKDSVKANKGKLYLASGVHIIGDVTTLILLNETWYKNYSRMGFHTYNDSGEWLQVDKVGHAWTAYTLAKQSTDLWRWAGVKGTKATLLGGFSALTFQTILEYLDAHSAAWGWSWADVGANIFGTSLFVTQDLLWKQQKIQFKFSSFPNRYHAELGQRVNDLYGTNIATRSLKDYNAQTYWLSVNAHSFLPKSKLPRWLNIAVGYGAQGMYGGYENIAKDKNGNITFYRPDIKRQRQFYVAPDIDFTKIKTNKKGVKTLLSFMNVLKFPAPALELSNGKIKGHLLSF